VRGDKEDAGGRENLSRRVLGDGDTADPTILNNSAKGVTPLIDADNESGSPRVTPADRIVATEEGDLDAGDQPYYESEIAAREEAERQNKISGLRRRLLTEAAERALHSKTPWADLSLVALGFKRAGDEEAARYWFERASRLALDPDDPRNTSRALREVVKYAVSAKYFEIATELIAGIPDSREKGMARAELVKAYARGRKFTEARQLAMSLGSAQSRGVALRSIAEAEARYVGMDAALMTLQSITHASERDRAFSSVAGLRAAMGDSDGAMSLLGQIISQRTRDITVAKIATIQEKGGKVSIEALAGLIHDPTFRDQVMREAILKEASRLGIDVASSSVDRIETDAARAKAFESLVMLQIRQGDLDGALARAQKIHQEDVRFRALQAVAVAEVRSNGTRSARNIANLIGDFEVRESTYGKIAQRAAIYGQQDGAVDTIQFIGDPVEKALAFATVALTQARYGQDRLALVLVQDAQRELTQIENARAKARAQGLMAEVFAETGDASSAMATAASISNSGLRDVTYQRVALSFAKISEPVLASQSAQQIERDTTREKAFHSIATTLASKVAMTEAVRFASTLGGHSQQVRFLLGVASRKS
ncbi:hypothetical protein N9195_03250, partial [bacterium]|nr:hypothetical protein [bacterium]